MKEFFEMMEPTERVFWYMAIGVSIVFIIQTIMTFVGADSDTGGDADFDSNLDGGDQPFQLFSLRNLVNFLIGFSWTGAIFYNKIDSQGLLIGLAAFVGVIFVIIFFLVMKSIMKLSEDNTFSIEEAIGKTAEVYLTIPANMEGKGKVMVSVNGTTRELAAVTTNQEKIVSRTLVKVIAVENNILVVDLF